MAGPQNDMTNCLSAIDVRVTDTMNEGLLQEFTAEEVSEALNQMSPIKAPGLMAFLPVSTKKIGPRLE